MFINGNLIEADYTKPAMSSNISGPLRILLAISLLVLLPLLGSGCSYVVRGATSGLADSLSRSIKNQNDPELVRDGAPAYLLLIDGLVTDAPEDPAMLMAASELYGAYAGAFVDAPERARSLALKSRNYATRGLCLELKAVCAAIEQPFEEFAPTLTAVDEEHAPLLYGFAVAWATWIQANSGDWSAVAEVPKITAAMERVVELEPDMDDGWPYTYLGVLATQLPPSYGGKPEEGRAHFEESIRRSGGQNLMAQVLFAQQYARLVFDQPLHDRLLREVLAADPEAQDFVLVNTLAQRRAKTLLEESNEYF